MKPWEYDVKFNRPLLCSIFLFSVVLATNFVKPHVPLGFSKLVCGVINASYCLIISFLLEDKKYVILRMEVTIVISKNAFISKKIDKQKLYMVLFDKIEGVYYWQVELYTVSYSQSTKSRH